MSVYFDQPVTDIDDGITGEIESAMTTGEMIEEGRHAKYCSYQGIVSITADVEPRK